MAKLICNIFNKDTEISSVYYCPAKHGKGCKGKLWDAYIRKRAALASAGVIQRRSYSVDAKKKTNFRNKKLKSVPPTCTLTKELEQSIKIIKSPNEPWSDIVKHWTLTHNYRKDFLRSNKNPATYITEFSSLTKPNGFELVILI